MDKEKFFKAVLQGKDEEVGEMLVLTAHHGDCHNDDGSSSSSYVTAQDKDGNTALHWAARQAFFRMARLLLNLGAPVNAMNHDGQTPLHLASFMDRCQMGCLLIDHGANLWALDKNGRKPISKQVAATERLASTFVKHKKEQDAWAQQNEQLIAILANKNRAKLETLLQDSHEKLSAEMKQQKTDILESSQNELAELLQTIQATTDTLQGRMDDLEQQQQQQQQHGIRGTFASGGENQDPQVLSAGPPKKRRLQMIATTTTTATSSTRRTSSSRADASRLVVCEAQLKEQAVEITALRAMILGGEEIDMATTTFASVPTTSTTTLKTASSASCTSSPSNSFGGSKVKMEPGMEHGAKMTAAFSDGSNAAATGTEKASNINNNNATAGGLLLELESTKLELQRVQAELQTTKESENRYKCKCEYYKDRMEQLNKIIKFQP